MQLFIGTKVVKAQPMTRFEYNEFRGWQLPLDEVGSDEGYLVEYVDGGKPNVPTHEGYVSWSPAAQFDKAYHEIYPIDSNSIDKKLHDKGLNAPRLSPDDIDEKVHITHFWQPEGTTLTVCAIQLRNGTLVVGESACVSPENFDAEIGKEIAFKNAWEKIWALEGYLLKQKLFEESQEGNTQAPSFL